MSRIASWYGHLRLMRPYAWLWFDLLPAATLILLLDPVRLGAGRLAAFLVAVVLADSGVSTLNDLCDVETDRRSSEANRNTRPLVTGIVSHRGAAIQAALLLAASPLMMALASWKSALAFSVAILLGIAYSLPPFRLSGRPWISQMVWPLLGLTTWSTVALFTSRWITTSALLYLAGVGFHYAVGEILAKDIRDWDNDRDTGKRTSVVVLGPGRAAACSLLACVIGTGFLVALLWWRAGFYPGFRLAGTAVLLLWLLRAAWLVHRLRRRYDKEAARQLHTGYIRTYLAINLCILLDAWLHPGPWI